MFWLLIGALGCVFVGGLLFPGWLRARPLMFAGLWLACALMTFFALLLAIADLLLLRVTARVVRRELHRRYGIDETNPDAS